MRREAQRGFTLVELAVALAVASITLAVIAPDFIATRRLSLAERSAAEATRIIEAAQWYYRDSNPGGSALDRVWPGQNAVGVDAGVDDDAVLDCLRGVGASCARRLLPDTMLTNAWGHAYAARVVSDALIVQSFVPVEVAGVVEASLPGGVCGERGAFCGFAPAPTGFIACCAVSPRPGREASIASMGMTRAACDGLNGVFDPANRRCETLEFDPTVADCNFYPGLCPDGYAVRSVQVQANCQRRVSVTLASGETLSACRTVTGRSTNYCCRNP